jgi:hypothetical protein
MWRALRTISCSICCFESLAVVRNEKIVTANISPPSSVLVSELDISALALPVIFGVDEFEGHGGSLD